MHSEHENRAEIVKQTYSDQVVAYIKKSILSGELRPGDKINEMLLAAKLSISRAPIREALQFLAREGIVVSIPQRGKFIFAPTARDIQEQYFTWGILEGAATAISIGNISPEKLSQLEAIIATMREAAQKNLPLRDVTQLDTEFHDIILSCVDNAFLKEISRTICRNIAKFLLFAYWQNEYTAQELYERHERLLAAIMTFKPEAIEKAFRDHYAATGQRMSRYGSDVAPRKKPR